MSSKSTDSFRTGFDPMPFFLNLRYRNQQHEKSCLYGKISRSNFYNIAVDKTISCVAARDQLDIIIIVQEMNKFGITRNSIEIKTPKVT